MTEPLVLLPDILCDAGLFWPQIATFSADTVVTVAPVTQAERIEDLAFGLLAQLPAKFALAGVGLGGCVALEMLARASDRITRIALIGTQPSPESPQFAALREPRIVAARSGRLSDCILEELPPAAFADGAARDMVLAQVMEMGLSLGPEAYVRQTRALQRRKDQTATLRRIKQPVLILCGEDDTITPVRRHEFMAELIPFAKLEVIAGAGHLPTLEQPEATTRALRLWMRQPLVLR